jgi:hypothetical protein
MPDLTIALSTAQETRARAALSFLNDDTVNAGQPVTAVQVRDWLKAQLTNAVSRFEINDAHASVEDQRRAELEAEGW